MFLKKYFPFIFLLVAYQSMFSQNYFPLNVGDKWYFENKPFSIDSTKQIGDFLYYKVPSEYYGDNYYRKDTLGNVYRNFNGIDTLIYKFDAELGETWLIPGEDFVDYEVGMISQKDSVIIWGDTLLNCVKLYLRGTNAFDADTYYWFAENIGLIKRANLIWGVPEKLSKGIFGGFRFPTDNEFLKVTSTSPADSQINVPVETNLEITFNYWIRPEFISNKYFELRYDNGKLIEGNVSFGSRENNVTFTPTNIFKDDSTITVTISASISDYIDDSLNSDYKFRFSTGEYITDIQQSEIKKQFHLSQNYPNPFNPTTKIKYQVASIENVSLKVYDILGREIVTLINNKPMQPGEYEVTFDGSNLPSGVYFYRITAGDFFQIRKMLLIK